MIRLMEYTPGPWEIKAFAIRTPSGRKVAGFDLMPSKSDARLIARAPQLAEAAEALAEALEVAQEWHASFPHGPIVFDISTSRELAIQIEAALRQYREATK